VNEKKPAEAGFLIRGGLLARVPKVSKTALSLSVDPDFDKHIPRKTVCLSRLHAVLPALHLVSHELLLGCAALIPNLWLLRSCASSQSYSHRRYKQSFPHNHPRKI
jgi:hypothetical protein